MVVFFGQRQYRVLLVFFQTRLWAIGSYFTAVYGFNGPFYLVFFYWVSRYWNWAIADDFATQLRFAEFVFFFRLFAAPLIVRGYYSFFKAVPSYFLPSFPVRLRPRRRLERCQTITRFVPFRRLVSFVSIAPASFLLLLLLLLLLLSAVVTDGPGRVINAEGRSFSFLSLFV